MPSFRTPLFPAAVTCLGLVSLLACGGGGASASGGSPAGSSPDFVLSVTAPGPVQAGGSGTAQATLTLEGGEDAPISLTLESNAQNITGAGSVAAGATQGSLAVAVPAGLAAGTYALTVDGSDGTHLHAAALRLQVTAPPAGDPWAPVTAAIQAAVSQFPNGICVEVITPAGLVYSQAWGGMTGTTPVAVASGSKWVAGTVILRLVDQGVFPEGLDAPARHYLKDAGGSPWAGNMGDLTLRDLLSFTSGIPGDDPNADVQLPLTFTLAQAVQAIYADFAATASAPNSYFDYGSTHLRIAAEMAEAATGQSWDQIFKAQVHDPLAWGASSIFDAQHPACQNPDPAGDLTCTGADYLRFLAMELRGGVDDGVPFLAPATWTAQRTDGYGPGTRLVGSPYFSTFGEPLHYALANWIGTANGQPESATNPPTWYGSTGAFGWAPWVAADGTYGAIVETQQSTQGAYAPSENLKNQLDPLIRQALAQNPPVLRSIP